MKKAAKKKTSKKATSKKKKTTAKATGRFGARRGLWKGSISFGLVNIPVYLESAQEEEKIHFRMIDKRDNAPVGYKQINKKTGKDITRAQITKGYEYKKGKYVLLTEADFAKANVKAVRAIDIEDFVDLAEVDPMLFEKPYYIVPQKGGEKGYALLQRVLKRTGKAAIAKIVLHTVQRLVTIFTREDHLVLEILRFSNEVKEIHEVDELPAEVRNAKITERELQGAEQLVESMTSKWKPDQYENTYRDDLMKMINAKIKKGSTASVEEVETPEFDEDSESGSNVIDLTALLKKSLNAAGSKSGRKGKKTEREDRAQ